MASISSLKASDGTGNASVATVQSVRSSGATTLVVDTVQGINTKFHATMGTPHTFVDPVTSETITVISEASAVDFVGHVDGSNLEIDTIAPGFTDAGSAVNDIVIIKPTTQWADQVATVLEVSHDDDGTLKAGAVDNAAVLADGVVTTAKIADSAVTPAKLSPTYVETIGTTDRTFTTSWAATGENIILTAGTWVVSYKASYTIALSSLSQGLITTLSTSTSSSNNINKFLATSYATNPASGTKEVANTHSVTGVYVAASSTTLSLMAKTQNSSSGTITASTTPILLTAYRIG